MNYDFFGNFIIDLKNRGMLDANFTIMEIGDDLGAWGYSTSGTMMWDENGKAWKIDNNPCMEFGTTELVYDDDNIEHRLIKPLRKHRAKEYDFKKK
ncbi:MAG: hypothetical protein LUC88_04510 [Prevotella sp.]|nr:hypothetical protein [Prevotella sp.]